MPLVPLYSIRCTDVAVRTVCKPVNHLVVFVSVVALDPMETNTLNVGGTLLIQIKEVFVCPRPCCLLEEAYAILTVGIDINTRAVRTGIHGRDYGEQLHAVVRRSQLAMVLHPDYLAVLDDDVRRTASPLLGEVVAASIRIAHISVAKVGIRLAIHRCRIPVLETRIYAFALLFLRGEWQFYAILPQILHKYAIDGTCKDLPALRSLAALLLPSLVLKTVP